MQFSMTDVTTVISHADYAVHAVMQLTVLQYTVYYCTELMSWLSC